ncbi:MAG: class II glutamine amidotransferase [bacterium]
MCGIAGILYKGSASDRNRSVGRDLVQMLESLRHRGADSTGVTVLGETFQGDLILRVHAPAPGTDGSNGHQGPAPDWAKRVTEVVEGCGATVLEEKAVDRFLRLAVKYTGELKSLAEQLLHVPGVNIHSIGRCSEVIKDVGDALALESRHQVSALKGTHGVGHVRLATESQVDITHSHPFWAYPFCDITVVHNGQLTNYHKMKRLFEQAGYRFQTHNDSELIAVYLAHHLEQDENLEAALHCALKDLDGTFTFLVSTPTGLGFAKDRWSAKPLVIMERQDVVAVASEEVALRQVFPEEIERFEPQENEVMTWSI